jgi:hypothetical protein
MPGESEVLNVNRWWMLVGWTDGGDERLSILKRLKNTE